MNSTHETLVKNIYQDLDVGYVSSFMMSVGSVCCLLTTAAASRFYRFNKQENELFFGRGFSQYTKVIVAVLYPLEAIHATSTYILYSNVPAGLTFRAESPAPWSMKLAFLSTALATFISQCAFTYILHIASGRKKLLTFSILLFLVLGLVSGIVSSLFGQVITNDNTLAFYISLTSLPAVFYHVAEYWSELAFCYYLARAPRTHDRSVLRTFKICSVVFCLRLLITDIPRAVTFWTDGHMGRIWSLAHLAGYEFVGNSFPFTFIFMLMLPGFAHWEDESEKIPI